MRCSAPLLGRRATALSWQEVRAEEFRTKTWSLQHGSPGGTLARAMASSRASYELRDGVLTIPLHVLTMPEGRIAVPNTTSSLYIEIGTNAFSTWDVELLPRRPNAFLVAFEPLVDKYALLLARNTRKRVAGKLGHHHKRGVVLPFAVSDHEGLADFHVAPRDGCSSLRSMHAPRYGSWNTSWTRTQCAPACSKCPLGSAPARLLCLPRARLAAPDSSALRFRGQPARRSATASGALASGHQSRRFHRL